jgi:CubicO group peptidase (beta-lactamase class C family)
MQMHMRLILTVLTLALAGTRSLAQGQAAKDPATDPEVLGAERLFSAWAEGQLAYHGYPGMTVGVVSGERLVWSRGFGLADVAGRVPMTAQTKFRMASHSKLFTATAIMQLREQGKLHLDDPVAKHLPGSRCRRRKPTILQSRSKSC